MKPQFAEPQISLTEIENFIEKMQWTFAKTMPHSPHEYIVKTKLEPEDQKLFEQFVLFIRLHGTEKKYKKAKYVHFDINGLSYWTMGAPLEITTIINRHDLSFYDLISDRYDDLFSDIESLRENGKILQFIGEYLKPDVSNQINILDIGCGSGLLLDLLPVVARNYLGIDPSGGMLVKFYEKHPGACLIQNTFEEQEFDEDEKFPFICSLFGSISYVNPGSFNKILELLAAGGKYFLMFYKPNYFPVTYQRTGFCFSHYKTDIEQLKEKFSYIYEYSNYILATNIEINENLLG